MSREMALVAYVTVCAASVVLWVFGRIVGGWAP